MDTHPGSMSTAQGPLEYLRNELLTDAGDLSRVHDAVSVLREISHSASEAACSELSQLAGLLASLLAIAESLGESSDSEELHSIVEFVRQRLPILQEGLDDADRASDGLRQLTDEARQRWGDCLELIDEIDAEGAEAWDAPITETEAEEEPPLPEPGQIGLILDSLVSAEVEQGMEVRSEHASSQGTQRPLVESQPVTVPPDATDDGPQDQLALDPEIREAYLDDARRCLASIEAALLAFENDANNRQPLQQVCRELHTLKGASASVGMSQLAHFLHQVEDDLQLACERSGQIEIEPILQCVDVIRQQTEKCQRGSSSPERDAQKSRSATVGQETFVDAGTDRQDSVRVKAAQLDRLMDMLAELVMLRNRRESGVEQLKEIHGELTRCVSRVRAFDDRLGLGPAGSITAEMRGPQTPRAHRSVSSLNEIANDLLEVGRSLRELFDPVAEENLAISRFIRHFRQELMQLRRVPMDGLFRRLQRATRDAARAEGKRAQLVLVGEDVGLERSIQEQLYEPLLHMVRNAVSHGIESESVRQAAGKDPVGTVVLEARGGSNLLVVTVRDDGRGLDYDALRRRGIEMGLISPSRSTTRSELARLIFHPGFSTRQDTTEISGRGVGMDVVASTLERMHSWVEVDSTPGEGTSVRLLVPLHSVIEHVMVFRAGDQEFGMPTQFVHSAGPWQEDRSVDFPVLDFADLWPGLTSARSATRHLLVLAQGWQPGKAKQGTPSADGDLPRHSERRLGLLIDEIVGPEEVVVRPLPGLLKNQRLFSGVTLSGTGDIMLLFDSQRLLDRGMALSPKESVTEAADGLSEPVISRDEPRHRALVVDDSRSSRRLLIELLRPHGWNIVEAADGLEALKLLRSNSYDLVFTDLEMPQLGGMELLREMNSAAGLQEIPVIVVSSRGEEEYQKEAAELGAVAYLVKPVSEPSLSEILTGLPIEKQRNNL